MAITVIKEPVEVMSFYRYLERCCFCREPTPFWVAPVTGESVACCEPCAATKTPADLPTKKEWCAREGALDPRNF